MIGKRKIGQLQSDGFLYFLFLKEGGRVFVGQIGEGHCLGGANCYSALKRGHKMNDF